MDRWIHCEPGTGEHDCLRLASFPSMAKGLGAVEDGWMDREPRAQEGWMDGSIESPEPGANNMTAFTSRPPTAPRASRILHGNLHLSDRVLGQGASHSRKASKP